MVDCIWWRAWKAADSAPEFISTNPHRPLAYTISAGIVTNSSTSRHLVRTAKNRTSHAKGKKKTARFCGSFLKSQHPCQFRIANRSEVVSAAHAVTFVQPICERRKVFDWRPPIASISHI